MDSEVQRLLDAVLWGAAALIAAFAAYFMLAPIPAGAGTIDPRVAHFLLYFVQAVVTLFAAVWRPGIRPRRGLRAATAVTAGVVAFATVLELAQSLVPERRTEIADLITNLLGAAAGFGAWRALLSARRAT